MDELLNFFSAVDNSPFRWKDLFMVFWLAFILGTSGYAKRHLVRIGNYINKKTEI